MTEVTVTPLPQHMKRTIFGKQAEFNLSDHLLLTNQCKSNHDTEQLFYFGGAFIVEINNKWFELKPVVCFAQNNEQITLAWFNEKEEKLHTFEIIVDKNKVHKNNILSQIDLNQFIKRID